MGDKEKYQHEQSTTRRALRDGQTCKDRPGLGTYSTWEKLLIQKTKKKKGCTVSLENQSEIGTHAYKETTREVWYPQTLEKLHKNASW